MDRFWSKVNKTDGCWLWIASRHKKGYGQFKLDGKMRKAHRVAWELTYGPIPPDKNVCHTCDNPPCVRPDHLFLGTNGDNVRDAVKKGRWHEHQRKVAIARWDKTPQEQRNTDGRLGRRHTAETRRRLSEIAKVKQANRKRNDKGRYL